MQVQAANAEDLHANLNINNFYVFQKPEDPAKSILIMDVNPMSLKLSQSDFFGDAIQLQLEQLKDTSQ